MITSSSQARNPVKVLSTIYLKTIKQGEMRSNCRFNYSLEGIALSYLHLAVADMPGNVNPFAKFIETTNPRDYH